MVRSSQDHLIVMIYRFTAEHSVFLGKTLRSYVGPLLAMDPDDVIHLHPSGRGSAYGVFAPLNHHFETALFHLSSFVL